MKLLLVFASFSTIFFVICKADTECIGSLGGPCIPVQKNGDGLLKKRPNFIWSNKFHNRLQEGKTINWLKDQPAQENPSNPSTKSVSNNHSSGPSNQENKIDSTKPSSKIPKLKEILNELKQLLAGKKHTSDVEPDSSEVNPLNLQQKETSNTDIPAVTDNNKQNSPSAEETADRKKKLEEDLKLAEKEIADKKQKLEEDLLTTEKETADKKKKLDEDLKSAEEEITNKKRKLEDELKSAEKETADKKQKLQDDLKSAEEETADKKKKLEEDLKSAEKETADKKQKLQDDLKSAEEETADKKDKLQDDLKTAEKETADKKQKLLDDLEITKKDVSDQKDKLEENLELFRSDIDFQKDFLERKITATEAQFLEKMQEWEDQEKSIEQRIEVARKVMDEQQDPENMEIELEATKKKLQAAQLQLDIMETAREKDAEEKKQLLNNIEEAKQLCKVESAVLVTTDTTDKSTHDDDNSESASSFDSYVGDHLMNQLLNIVKL